MLARTGREKSAQHKLFKMEENGGRGKWGGRKERLRRESLYLQKYVMENNKK